MKSVLITGSQGYFGSVLLGYLNKKNFNCSGFDIGYFINGSLEPSSDDLLCYKKDAKEVNEDDIIKYDAIVHLAGISNDPLSSLNTKLVYDPTEIYTKRIAKLAKKHKKKFIFASSCSVYGLSSDGLLNENSQTNPQTGYSKNKLNIEAILANLADNNFKPVALRFATIFGMSPRIRFDVVVNMFVGMGFTESKIVLNSNGQAWRPNLHILDACKAVEFALNTEIDDEGLSIINVGDEKNNKKIIEIAEMISNKIRGCSIKYLSENPDLDKEKLIIDRKIISGNDVRTYKVSFSKIKCIFEGYTCDWSLEQGIDDLIKNFSRLNLTSEQFKSRDFYRLQQLEHLHQSGFLNDQLEFVD